MRNMILLGIVIGLSMVLTAPHPAAADPGDPWDVTQLELIDTSSPSLNYVPMLSTPTLWQRFLMNPKYGVFGNMEQNDQYIPWPGDDEPAEQRQLLQNVLDRQEAAFAAGAVVLKTWKNGDIHLNPTKLRSWVIELAERQHRRVLFNFAVIMTTVNTIPGRELYDSQFTVTESNPTLQSDSEKFEDALDNLDGSDDRFKDAVYYFSIGNEVDIFLDNQSQPGDYLAWIRYAAFFDEAAQIVRQKWGSDVRIGTTFTKNVVNEAFQDPVRAFAINWIKSVSDVVIVNYYPLADTYGDPNLSWTPEAPQAAADEFQDLIDFAGTKPLVVQEVGYPSSPLIGSSEANQQEFVQFLLNKVKTDAPNLEFLSWFSLHDWYSKELNNPTYCYVDWNDMDCFYELDSPCWQNPQLCSWENCYDSADWSGGTCRCDPIRDLAEEIETNLDLQAVCDFDNIYQVMLDRDLLDMECAAEFVRIEQEEKQCGNGDLLSLGFGVWWSPIARRFNAYLGTCGLYTADGTAKPARDTFANAVRKTISF